MYVFSNFIFRQIGGVIQFLLILLRLFLNFWDFLALSEYGMVLLVQILKGRA